MGPGYPQGWGVYRARVSHGARVSMGPGCPWSQGVVESPGFACVSAGFESSFTYKMLDGVSHNGFESVSLPTQWIELFNL